MKRAMRVLYLIFVTSVAAFFVGLGVFNLVEAAGGSESADGRVIERISGEKTTKDCTTYSYSSESGCIERTYPTFTLIGERVDGSTWLVVGQGAYDATRGERGTIVVSTSNVTGRVIGLESERDQWRSPSGLYVLGSVGFLIFWAILVSAYESRRRSGAWKMGSFERAEFSAVIPGVAFGLFAAGYSMLGPAWGLEAVTSAEAEGTFLDDPFGYADVQIAEQEADRPGVQVNQPFTVARIPTTVIGGEYLTEKVRTAWTEAPDVLAIPILQVGQATGRMDRTFFRVFADGTSFDSVRCPATLLPFPSGLGAGESVGGFVCFDAAATGGEFQIWVGSNLIQDLIVRPAYPLPDGTVIDAPTQ